MPLSIYLQTSARSGELWFEEVTPTVVQFLQLFGTQKPDRMQMQGLQQASVELKLRVATFCNAHSRAAPQLSAFAKLIRDLRDDEAFLLLKAPPETSAAEMAYGVALAKLNGETTLQQVYDMDATFGTMLSDYDVHNLRTDRHILIGNKERDNRACRFCHRTTADKAKFSNVAHAISAALGNRYLKLADECDCCNEFFGKEIEPHLIALLDFPRVLLGIEARGGRPEIPIQGGRMYHDGEKVIIEIFVDEAEGHAKILEIHADGNLNIIPERVYRAFAKIALSVIEEPQLAQLRDTVEWVRHGRRPEGRRLPVVHTAIVPLPPNPSAQITLYVRRSERSQLPHVVGEFRLGCYLYAFVLPFSKHDENDGVFIGDTPFMDVFRHYAAVRPWRPLDLDDADATSPSKLRFVEGAELP